MQVDRTGAKAVGNAYQVNGARPGGQPVPFEGTAAPAQADQIAVSAKAQQAASLRTQLRAVPEVRMELVERIKAQIAAGTYQIDARAVAERLLKAKVLD